MTTPAPVEAPDPAHRAPRSTAPPVTVVDWAPDGRGVRLLNQRALPTHEQYVDVRSLSDMVAAIATLTVRGAPAIGVAAALGLVVAADAAAENGASVRAALPEIAAQLEASRPTAVNLAWAVRRVLRRAEQEHALDDRALLAVLRNEATQIRDEDRAMCRAIGQFGAEFVPNGARVLTHCNAGALATAGVGTALAPVYAAHAMGRQVTVHADETRPLLQGARLTAWELQRAGIPVTVLPDGAAASLLRAGAIDAVFVGADRITANGDVANKVGTYPLALAAHAHNVPFYVCAPWSTVDVDTATGDDVHIEQRGREELAVAGDRVVLPNGVPVFNPAFDITPRSLVTAYITDRGVVTPPFA